MKDVLKGMVPKTGWVYRQFFGSLCRKNNAYLGNFA